MKKRWVNSAAAIYHTVGIFYYLYQIFLISGVGGLFLSFILKYFIPQIIFLRITLPIISLGFFGAGIIFWAKVHTNQFQSHNPGLRLLLIEHIYTHLGANKYLDFKRIIAKALWNGVDHYIHKFNWSGQGEITPTVNNPRQKIQLFKQPHGTFQVCKIEFERPLRVEEKIEFSYDLKLTDHARIAQSFLNQNVHCQIDKLILRARFSKEKNIKTYKKRIFMSSTSDIPIWEQEMVLPSDSNEACWEIKRPRIGFRYQIIW